MSRILKDEGEMHEREKYSHRILKRENKGCSGGSGESTNIADKLRVEKRLGEVSCNSVKENC